MKRNVVVVILFAACAPTTEQAPPPFVEAETDQGLATATPEVTPSGGHFARPPRAQGTAEPEVATPEPTRPAQPAPRYTGASSPSHETRPPAEAPRAKYDA